VLGFLWLGDIAFKDFSRKSLPIVALLLNEVECDARAAVKERERDFQKAILRKRGMRHFGSN